MNVPDILKASLAADKYSKGKADYSVTGILKPPQITHLAARHEPREFNWSDSWAAWVGTAIHATLEETAKEVLLPLYPNAVIESHFSLPVLLMRVLGRAKRSQYKDGVPMVAAAMAQGDVDGLYVALR